MLRFRNVRKSFPGVVALNDVSFDVAAGRIHAIAGENGAGKSTLMKVLSGAHRPDSGTIELDGRAVRIDNARVAQRLGIAIVYQELSIARDLSVAENVFLGRWPSAWGVVDFGALRRRAEELLGSLGVSLPLGRAAGELTVAQQQIIEIARALSLDARILVLDEPSAVLTPHELDALFRLVRALRARGVAVLYISHRLEELFDLADDVTVLRDGRHISTRPVGEVTRQGLILDMVGRDLSEEFPPRSCPVGEAVLRVRGLSAGRRFREVSFDVRAGEVFALTGLVGSGRTSVLKAIFGAVTPDAGTVAVGSASGPFASPRQAIAAGVGMLPEDRKGEGLLMGRSVAENISLADLSRHARGGVLSLAREQADARSQIADLRIKTPSPDAGVSTLSGGHQQKTLLARWMGRRNKVILFDEPTRGVDVGAKTEIYALMNRLAGEGVAVVMASSELSEVIGMADRIGVMHAGRLVGILDNRPHRATQAHIMSLATGEEIRA
jgi:ABC-type sugar transport system ATPase subunit